MFGITSYMQTQEMEADGQFVPPGSTTIEDVTAAMREHLSEMDVDTYTVLIEDIHAMMYEGRAPESAAMSILFGHLLFGSVNMLAEPATV